MLCGPKLLTKPECGSIESDDLCVGFGFLLSVRKLGAEIIFLIKKPLLLISKTEGFADELKHMRLIRLAEITLAPTHSRGLYKLALIV